ncbi:hypothetical protein E3O11_12875 [Cryobacterium levicorallinum]|uniref:Leucine rich repeat variant n=1 Tax=Cryobacterium levicorallinum TaxID=995038 RepID=A0A1I2ZZ76_9MICO|nr:hypothetical protein [Cryobacterium levicorallinum]TFB82757.1 hypothetical protein E3O11_12875 [Cryobacterium levicorallinum]GEP26457.1 hypothetical protein CLE01_10550 [Cryobacterium levicorallinum]SFH43084.1 Leucine rich repeat variant [Cryobacterium levicorallinum]
MSLTEHLADSGSPVRAYIDGISPILLALQGGTGGSRAAADTLGLIELAASSAIIPPLPGVDVARAGTAVDFRVRIALGGFDAHDSVAALGIDELSLRQGEFENGAHRAKVLSEAFDVAVQILENPSSEADLDRAALLLAHCEQIHRDMIEVLKGSVGKASDLATDGQDFAVGLDTPSLADLRSMMESNSAQIDLWREQIANGDRFEPNPVFAGSRLVGGADADWLVGGVLIDSKAYAELTVPKLRAFLRQLLGYVMLDLDDSLHIRTVGVWLPRQGLTRTWELEMLLGGDPEELLLALRQRFAKAAGGQQIGIRVPVTQHRKDQILADNKNTPRHMLIDLARSIDAGIRFRIGRNAMVPEETMRELARDRYASVREGVAGNESAPTDVLAALSQDNSVVVRRTVAANPRTPKPQLKALGQAPVDGSSSETQLAIESVTGDEVAQPRSSGRAVVRVAQDRDDLALETRWFMEFLALSRGGFPRGLGVRIPLPMASQYWASVLGRSTYAPDWLTAGFPDIVKNDLMRTDRPAWVRQIFALELPVSDSSVRDRLLADADPLIRWSALQRTVDVPDDVLGALLGELAASRKERIRFRTEGDRPMWARTRTPAEYDKETLRLVATHPSTPLAELRELLGTKSVDVLVGLIENPSLPTDDLALILPRLRSTKSFEPRERLAASSRIPSAAARLLVDDRDARVRIALSRNEAAPSEALVSLAEDQEPSVRLAVISNPSAPVALAASIAGPLLETSTDEELFDVLNAVATRTDIELTDELFEDALGRLSKSRVRDPDMRRIAADDERTGARTLARLAKSTDESVRSAVAGNSRTPSETLSVLAADPVHNVRAAAAGNEGLDTALLVTLAYDDDPLVRARAAGCPRLGTAVLGALLLDDDRSVRSAAFKNPATSTEDRDHAGAAWEQAYLASGPSRADLEETVASKRAEVRIQVAFDRRTPSDFLVLLGGERRSAQVRRAVAANPNTPATFLASLADDADTEVRQAVAFNSATPREVLAKLAGTSIDLALLVAMNPDAPLGLIDALVEDGDPLVGYVAAGVRATRAALTEGGVPGTSRADAHKHETGHPMILP